jgi:hypothetical protein
MTRTRCPAMLVAFLLAACSGSSDGGGGSTPAPLRPVASAGPDRFAVTAQTLVQLDGTGSSDPEGRNLTYAWERVSAPPGSVAVVDAITHPAQPTFTPDRSGTYVFRLQVNNGVSVSDWDQVTVSAGAQDAVAVASGAGQSAVVGDALAEPVVFRVTNASGMPVRYATVAFSTASGRGTLAPASGLTDASGEVSAALTAGTVAGGEEVVGTCSSCATTKTARAGATLLADVAASVVPELPADAPVDGTMSLRMVVLDQYGNVATGDSTTRFTVAVSGSATFASATQGTILAGEGTASVLVQASAGEVVLAVTDGVAEAVTFTVTDSENNLLAYPGSAFQATAPSQALACSSPYRNTFAFDVSNVTSAVGDATLTVRATGHFDSTLSDYLEVLLETATGTSYGKLADENASFCVQLEAPVTIPLASLSAYAADGTVGVVTRTPSYQCIFCGGSAYTVQLELTYPVLTQAEFY